MRLCAPDQSAPALPALGAAALAAFTAVALACAVILGLPGMAHGQAPLGAAASFAG